MKRVLVSIVLYSVTAAVLAQRIDDLNGKHTQLFPSRDQAQGWARPGGGGGQNLTNHGGPVITTAKVVAIFWGPSWGSNGKLGSVASEMLNFYAQFGTTPEYNVITQYSGIQQTNLTNNFWWDTSAPPTNVSDSAIQAEVVKYFNQGGVIDASTIYEVFLPPTSYASFGNSDSCGGPNLVFCAYHSNFGYGNTDVKYASMPYPTCSGCQWTGFTDAQNFEHFACHETREAVTDPDGTAWYDRRGYEADDKCAWSPAPFLGTGGFGYQWEWSNAVSGCVKSQ
jgi:hypothetical protein